MLHAIWFAQDKVSLLENEAKSKAEELAKVLGILPVSQRFSFFFPSLSDVSVTVFIKAV